MTVAHSILIPTKDRPDLLLRAVHSACRALAENGEILVIDDHSQRPAREILQSLPEFVSGQVRVHRNQSPCGISAARNTGLNAAQGEVIFFLDDDDALSPDYCARVLGGPAQHCDYGFSSYRLIHRDGTPSLPRPRFATGVIPPGAPLRKQLCGMGMGFWIHRSIAQEIGPFDTGLPINEDTDYVCRLIVQQKRAWYEATPGVDVHQHDRAGNLGNITRRTRAVERAQAMQVVCARYPALAVHLGQSYLRHCARAGLHVQARAYIKAQPAAWLRLRLWLFFKAKRLAHTAARADTRD